MPPPWSSLPFTALKATLTSRSLKLVPSATQRLNSAFGPAAVWARTWPVFDGAVSSAITFQMLPSPSPVLSAFQPAGSLPTSPLTKEKVREGACSATDRVVAGRTTAAVRMNLRMMENSFTEKTEAGRAAIVGYCATRRGLAELPGVKKGRFERTGKAWPG